jgi:hypothetical protein
MTDPSDVTIDAPGGAFVWVDLPQPRPLGRAERDVLDALVAYASCQTLTEQAESARVTATCGCGCSSVRLCSDGPPVPAEVIRALSSIDRDDYLGVSATAGGEPTVDVVIHVLTGVLTELELYAGDGVRVDPPRPEDLRQLQII